MGFIPTIYPKDVIHPDESNLPGSAGYIPGPSYLNAGGPFDWIGDAIGAGSGLVNTIIGSATGTTQQQLAAQQAMAQAQLAQAEADRLKALRKGKTTIAVVAISAVTLGAIVGFALYFKYRKKGAATGK